MTEVTVSPRKEGKLEAAKTALNSVVKPPTLNRDSYEYKLAAYYYWLFQKEKSDHDIDKQELVATTGAMTEFANAYHGMDRKQLTAQKIADQDRIAEVAACSEIDNIIKPSRFSGLFKITWQVVALASIIGFLFLFATNEGFRVSLLSNIGGLIVIGLIVVVGIYFWRSKK